ncbi:MAG: glycosyltransferase, partial [Pyrinomonadaceae bacterium]
LLFDIRGFFPEEYTDAGRWKENGLIYRAVKRVEKWLLKESDGFVILTEKAREILFPESKETGEDTHGRPVEVIPCCVDLERFSNVDQEFRDNFRKTYGLNERLVVAYVGAFGGWYLTRETVDFLAAAKRKRPDTFALILTQSPREEVTGLLTEAGFSDKDYWIGKVRPEEIPNYLSTADFGLSFIKACYSKKSSSPTKNAEYFAMGLPILANSGVGDTAEFTKEDGVGIIIEEFDERTYADALSQMIALLESKDTISDACRKSALKRFDLKQVGGVNYRRIYKKLLEIK